MRTAAAPRPRRSTLRRFATVALPMVLFFAWISIHTQWPMLYCIRAALWFAQELGLMDTSRGLGGQIAGFNYYRHPQWVHWISWFIGSLGGFGLTALLALVVHQRLSTNRHGTRCGVCGANVDEAGGFVRDNGSLACPACGAKPGDSSKERPARFFMARRYAAALATFAIINGLSFGLLYDPIRRFIINAAEYFGVEVLRFNGFLAFSPAGPFRGDSHVHQIWNLLYRNGPWVTPAVAAFAASLVVLWMCSNRLGRTRLFGYRGPTRCGRCRYSLVGITAEQCPECGKSL